MDIRRKSSVLLAGVVVSVSGASYGFQFSTGSIKGDFVSTITTGVAKRVSGADCGSVGDPNSSCGAGANVAQFSNGDNGDLNYKKGDLFASYIKGTHELLLNFPDGYKFLGRGTWLYDFKATDTRRTDLEPDAKDQLARDVRLLDFWGSKDFTIGSQTARLRIGNQVLNWGESVYGIGGINATNSLDYQKLAVPGTQLKEAVLPAPMISFATGLGSGVSLDSYYQFRWNQNRYPPVGSFFSVSDIFGKGREPLYLSTTNFNFGGVDAASISGSRDLSTLHQTQNGLVNGAFAGPPFNSLGFAFADDKTPKNTGQYGLALHYKPESTTLDLGIYYLNYHDKAPVLGSLVNGQLQWNFLENRKLYGVSANFPLGDWAMGWELSYRPKDAVALTGCFNPGGPLDANTNAVVGINCQQWIDEQRYQMHLSGQLNLTPANYPTILSLLGKATTAYLTAEAVFIRYPGVSPDTRYTRTVDGVQVVQAPSAAYNFWRDNSTVSTLGYPITGAAGTANSWGFTTDFNWTYDGSLIPGWQVTPGVTYVQAVKGFTPTYTANYLEGAKYANFYVLFNQNPVKWQAGLNYSRYFGGDNLTQLFGDRDFVGGFVAYNF